MDERAEAYGEAQGGRGHPRGGEEGALTLTVLLPRPQNEAVQALRRAQLQYVQRSEDLRVRSQASPEDPAPQASPGPSKQQERRRRSREEAQAKVGTPTACPTPVLWCPLGHAVSHTRRALVPPGAGG